MQLSGPTHAVSKSNLEIEARGFLGVGNRMFFGGIWSKIQKWYLLDSGGEGQLSEANSLFGHVCP